MWDELPDDVRDELLDPEFAHRQHHSRSTSRDGCRGPLCKKAEREYKAQRDARRALKAGKTLRSLPPDKRRPGDIFRDELLNKIFAWHMLERSRPKEVVCGDEGERPAEGGGAGHRPAEPTLGTDEAHDDSLSRRAGVSGAA